MKELGNRLKQIQSEKGMSQIQLAELLNITPASLSNYINDKKSPTIDIVAQMAKRLNVSIGWLLGEETVRRGNVLKDGDISYAYLISIIEEMLHLDGKFTIDVDASVCNAKININDDTICRYFILADVLNRLDGAFAPNQAAQTLKDHLHSLENLKVNMPIQEAEDDQEES